MIKLKYKIKEVKTNVLCGENSTMQFLDAELYLDLVEKKLGIEWENYILEILKSADKSSFRVHLAEETKLVMRIFPKLENGVVEVDSFGFEGTISRQFYDLLSPLIYKQNDSCECEITFQLSTDFSSRIKKMALELKDHFVLDITSWGLSLG